MHLFYSSVFILFMGFLCSEAIAKPTVYQKNAQDKLQPVLIPISSTVIPLPIYKVSYSIGVKGEKSKLAFEEAKLITARTKKQKKEQEKIGASVKLMSREDFEKPAYPF